VLTRFVSAGGIAAAHPPRQEIVALVGPATADQHNTVRAGIIPVACWRLEDVRFEFDSSVVMPGIAKELEGLALLVKEHPPASKSDGKPGFPLSVFGHADPVGNDDYNKQLSGRRATAIYGMLTRDTNLWEKLFSQPFGNDKWGRRSLQIMLDAVSPATAGQQNQADAVQHERSAAKRRDLFARYMETVCGPDLKLEKRDFLGHGDDGGGKGDFQGCSEFNPILIFSQQDQNRFARDKDTAPRDKANAPNRRVMVLIFRKGSRVDPAKWPCPRASEGAAGCRKRFFIDGDLRRSTRLTDAPRRFEDTKKTFACRFYHRLVERSPCEITLKTFEVRLYTPIGRALPLAPCEVTIGSRKPFVDTADARGIIVLRDVEVPATCTVRWGFPPDQGREPELIFTLDLFLNADEPADSDRAGESAKRLNNLGYTEPDFPDNVRHFQRDYGHLASPPLTVTGTIDDPTFTLLKDVYEQSADDLRNTPVS
jgi:hypothetical protein